MMIMDFAANDFGWAVFLAGAAPADWISFFFFIFTLRKKDFGVAAGIPHRKGGDCVKAFIQSLIAEFVSLVMTNKKNTDMQN